MREIKFRGLFTSPNGVSSMVYGNYIKSFCDGKEYHEIEHSHFEDFRKYTVDPETVGQYTGLKDDDVIDIYEGDLRLHTNESTYRIEWDIDEARFTCVNIEDETDVFYLLASFVGNSTHAGNIHQHPHLLK